MLGVLRTVAARAWAVLPQLIALYLVGRFAHDVFFWWAAHWAPRWPYWSAVILPLGMLSQLAALIGMLLVMRPAIDDWPAEEGAIPANRRRQIFGAMTAAVLPFIAFYAAWRYLANDYRGYLVVARDNALFKTPPPIIEKTALTLAIAGVLLLIRLTLKRFRSRLPSWSIFAEFYLEAAWIYLLIGNWLTDLNIKKWVETRRFVVWVKEDLRALVSQIPGVDAVWGAVSSVVGQVVGVLVVPLGWLALAGVVYALVPATTWADARRIVLGGRRGEAAVERLANRRSTEVFAWPFRAQATAFRDAMYVILHAGAVPIGVYVLAYTCLGWVFGNASESPGRPGWLARGLSEWIGPHESHWWLGMSSMRCTCRASARGSLNNPQSLSR